MVQLWGTDLQYLDPRRFSVSELCAHNHWCLYSKYGPYEPATVWNVTVLGVKKLKESRQVGSGLDLQASAFISTMQPAAFAFIAVDGGRGKVVAIAVKLTAVPETWAAESRQNWPVSLRTHLDIFFVLLFFWLFFFSALPLVPISLPCSSLLLKTLSCFHCKSHPNPSLFFLLFLPSSLSLFFSFLHCLYIHFLSSLHLQQCLHQGLFF